MGNRLWTHYSGRWGHQPVEEKYGSEFYKVYGASVQEGSWGTETLSLYKCEKDDRRHQFWKRDPLAIAITSEAAFLQKLDYTHNNPVREKWKLCTLPEEYRWSSARFYWEGVDEFGILTHYRE